MWRTSTSPPDSLDGREQALASPWRRSLGLSDAHVSGCGRQTLKRRLAVDILSLHSTIKVRCTRLAMMDAGGRHSNDELATAFRDHQSSR